MTNNRRVPAPSPSEHEHGTAGLPEPDATADFRITKQQWDELEDCVIAFHAALDCNAHEGGEGAELMKAVYVRMNAAVTDIRATIFGGR